MLSELHHSLVVSIHVRCLGDGIAPLSDLLSLTAFLFFFSGCYLAPSILNIWVSLIFPVNCFMIWSFLFLYVAFAAVLDGVIVAFLIVPCSCIVCRASPDVFCFPLPFFF